jgi:hypothetical protein
LRPKIKSFAQRVVELWGLKYGHLKFGDLHSHDDEVEGLTLSVIRSLCLLTKMLLIDDRSLFIKGVDGVGPSLSGQKTYLNYLG